MREDIAWSIGLMGPFLISLVALRVTMDRLIPANMEFGDLTNFIGGGAFGLLSAVISVGMLTLSVGFLRLPPDFLGYRLMDYGGGGSLTTAEGSSLWVPVDRLTTEFFERLSVAGFGSSSPLARRHPNLHQQASAMRASFEGKGRITLKPQDVTAETRYTVVADDVNQLLSDTFIATPQGEPVPQRAVMPDGEPYPRGSRLEGFALTLDSGARETGGQVIIGPGQLRLVCNRPDAEAIGLHPITVISRTAGDTLQLGRFRFDAPEVFVSSVGGASEVKMAFEFVVPPEAEPVELLVKNVRIPVRRFEPISPQAEQGLTPEQRDQMVRDGSLLGVQVASSGPSGSPSASTPTADGATGQASTISGQVRGSPVQVSSSIPVGSFDKQRSGGLEISGENQIVRGEHTFSPDEFEGRVPRGLSVEQFTTSSDTRMVQVDVSMPRRTSIFGRALSQAEEVLPPVLIDHLGQSYQAVGYVYRDRSEVTIRYTRNRPIRGLTEIPTLSRVRQDQELVLLFTVSSGVRITEFSLGGQKTIVRLDPPLQVR